MRTLENHFRPGTKRDRLFRLLTRKTGVTASAASKVIGWPEHVMPSNFHEIAALVSGAELQRDTRRDGTAVYALVPVTRQRAAA